MNERCGDEQRNSEECSGFDEGHKWTESTSGVYSIMSMKQLASSEKLGELKKERFWLLGGND